MLAARHGHGAVVEALLAGGANPETTTDNGTTVLMFAAASGDVASVEAIVKRNVDLNAREVVRGLTAAMFAAAANHAAVVTALGKAGADLAATSDPLDLKVVDRTKFKGVLFGNPEPPKEPGGEAGSVEGGGGRNGGNATGRNNSVYAPPAAATRVPGVDRDFSGNELVNTHGGLTPLLFAARQGYIETAAALLDAGVDVNQAKIGDDTTPLMMATINGHFDLAKVLLDRGADPNRTAINGITPLYQVINIEWSPRAGGAKLRAHKDQKLSYLDMMTLLLDKGADPNARLATKVWYGGNLSGVNEQGATPFWRAAYAADIVAMKLLVSRGADPAIPDHQGPHASADRRWSAGVQGCVRPPADSAWWSWRPAARRRGGRRLRRGLCRQHPQLRADGDDGGGEVPGRGAGRGRQRVRSRGQHGDAQRRRARRRGDDQLPGREGRGPEGRQPRGQDDGGHGEWPGAAHSAVAGGAGAAGEAGRGEQSQVRVVLTADAARLEWI